MEAQCALFPQLQQLAILALLWCKLGTIDLNQVRIFVAVHETSSFSAAAKRLDLPRSSVSRAISGLEGSLGQLLFQRTTRRVASTAEGAALYERVGATLRSLERSLGEVPERDEEPVGTLRITTTADIGTMVLAEALALYSERWPKVNVEVRLSSSLVDLMTEGVDLAVRIASRARKDSSLVSRKLGQILLKLYASPAYVARRGEPVSSAELTAHDWISFHGAPALRVAGAKRPLVMPAPRVVADDMFFCRQMLRHGAGIGTLPSFIADPDVTAGRLVRILPRWVVYTGTAFLVQPSRKHVPARVTAFRDLLLEMLRQRPLSS
jgi:DNA-binding transcriptional LysR family regulator